MSACLSCRITNAPSKASDASAVLGLIVRMKCGDVRVSIAISASSES